ncbi:MAG: hypothetical protein ACKPB0_06715 [Opitutaceae bacterium]
MAPHAESGSESPPGPKIDGDEAGESPEDDHEALQVRAGDAGARGELITRGAADAHVVAEPGVLHHAHQQDGREAEDRKLLGRAGAEEVEHAFGHLAREFRPAADRVQARRDEQHGEDDDEHALEPLVHRRRRHSAHHDVGADHEGEHGVEHEVVEHRHVAAQLAVGVAVAQRVERQTLRGRQLPARLPPLERLELAVALDRGALRRAPLRLGFHDERRGDLIGGDVAETEEDAGDENLEGRVEEAEPAAGEAVLEQIRKRREPHPAEPDVHEPEVGIHEHGLEREPRARRALLVDEARRAHRPLRFGRVAEVEE